MPAIVVPGSATDHTVLTGSLTVRTASQLHSQLLQAIRSQPAIRIDCTAAEEVDLSFIQLVLAARKSAEACGKTLSLAAPATGALLDRLCQTGLVAAADDPPIPGQGFWLEQGEA